MMGSSSGNPSYNSGGPAGTYNSEKENSGHSSTEAIQIHLKDSNQPPPATDHKNIMQRKMER
jgi:hypothetical protein